MKKTFKSLMLLMSLMVAVVACKYDDGELWDKVNSLDDRLTSIESQLSQMNSDINSISTIVNALQNKVYVSSVNEVENGYQITFTDGKTVKIANGKDGADGKDGENGKDAPVISIDEFEGKYYWVQIIDGKKSWLTDKSDAKVPVTGEDGVTPILKVNTEGYWVISYDRGISFALLLDETNNPVKAVGKDGEDGKDGMDGYDGTDGMDGDSFFKDVKVEGSELVLTLADGTELRIPLSVSESSLESIVMVTEGIGDWDEAYVTPYGYFSYSDELPADEEESRAIGSRSLGDKLKALNFLSTDKKTSASMILSATEGLPLQLITEDGILNFSFPNDSILELIHDNGSELEMLDSIAYSHTKMEEAVAKKGYNNHLQKALYFFNALVKGHTGSHFGSFISMFDDILKLKIDIESETTIEKLGLPKEGTTFTFVTKINIWHQTIVIPKVYYSVVMWTGKASYKVGGSSCTLSGTIWCATQKFNEYGTYGIVCDENPDNLLLGKAEYEGEGFQDKLELSYDVDFRGFKPNTKYYYRAYYKFNSSDHGNLRFKYGDKNAQVGYDYVIKSFTTGDNTLNVDVVMCIDVTGSMSDIINTVKNNALSFYDSFNNTCIKNGIGLTSLNTQVIAFRDKNVDTNWLEESPVYSLPADKNSFESFVNGLRADGGGDIPESSLEALERAFSKTDWGKDDGYHRQVVILWTDAPYLKGSAYTGLTPAIVEKKWNDMPSGRRFILFAPNDNSFSNGGAWSNISSWKNLMHSTNLGAGFGDMEHILEKIITELTGRSVAAPATPSNFVELIPRPNN